MDVAEWLKNGDYEQGVQLYKLHGKNTFLKEKFAAGINDYNSAKLREELQKLAPSAPETAIETKGTPNQGTPATSPIPPKNAQENAVRYAKLTKQKQKLYQEQNMLMADRHHLQEGEQLRVCAVRILTISQQLTEVWAQIDYYQEHQCFPDDLPPVQPTPAIEPKKKMQLLRQSISKAKSRLKKPTCRDSEQTQKLIDDSKAELALLVAAKKKKA